MAEKIVVYLFEAVVSHIFSVLELKAACVAISSEAPIPSGLHEVLALLLSLLPPGIAVSIPFTQGDMCAFKTLLDQGS